MGKQQNWIVQSLANGIGNIITNSPRRAISERTAFKDIPLQRSPLHAPLQHFNPPDSASGHLELDDASDTSMTMTLALCVYGGVWQAGKGGLKRGDNSREYGNIGGGTKPALQEGAQRVVNA